MSRGFQAVSVRREGKVHETRFTEAQGIQGLDGLVGIAAVRPATWFRVTTTAWVELDLNSMPG